MVYDSTIKKTCFHQDFVNIDLRVWELPYFKCFFKCLLNHKYNLVFFYWCFSLISGRLCPFWLLKHVIVQEDFFFKVNNPYFSLILRCDAVKEEIELQSRKFPIDSLFLSQDQSKMQFTPKRKSKIALERESRKQFRIFIIKLPVQAN